MSDINLDFTVNSSNVNVTVEPNDITFTPNAVQLTVYTASAPIASGTNSSVQFNFSGALFGTNAFTFNTGTNTATVENLVTSNNANLGDASNVTILGGVNGYFLQTDGTGNLTWAAGGNGGGGNGTPGGSNTQIQYNDAGLFGGNAGFTFNEVSGNVNIPGNLIVAGSINGSTGNANYANFAGTAFNVSGSNVSGTVANATYAVSAGSANTANTANSATIANSANTANTAGTVTTNAQPNITSVGTLTSLSVSGNLSAGNANLGNLATANFFSGNGSLLTNVNASLLSNGTSNVNIQTANGNVLTAVNGNTITTTSANGFAVIGNVSGSLFSGNISATTATIGTANIGTLNWPSNSFSISLGTNSSANTTGGTSYGYNADSGQYAVALGYSAQAPGQETIAIGRSAGSGGLPGTRGVYIGVNAGSLGNISDQGRIAIGYEAGGEANGGDSIAIGSFAGNTLQNDYGIAIGYLAGANSQGDDSIAIGRNAGGSQGVNAIAIGRAAAGNTAVPQANNSIVINATGITLDGSTANALFIKPVRNVATANVLYYNDITGEITYNSAVFGSFTSNVTQTNPVANTVNYMTFNNDEGSNGVSIVSNSQVTIARTGRYNMQFSAVFTHDTNATANVEIWLTKNGTSVANTNTRISLTKDQSTVAAWNFLENVTTANTYYQIAWASSDTNVELLAVPSANTIAGVAIPSVIATVVPVGI